jgi:hypothetical protein
MLWKSQSAVKGVEGRTANDRPPSSPRKERRLPSLLRRRQGPGSRADGFATGSDTPELPARPYFCTQRFRPITIERPKALLPLVNIPMIEYALEWLATNNVEEVRPRSRPTWSLRSYA